MFGDTFASPEYLWLLVAIPVTLAVFWYRRRRLVTDVLFSSLEPFKRSAATLRERLRYAPAGLRLLAVGCLVIAMARPQAVSSRQDITTEGIDIVLVLDISGSMLAEDFVPNRLSAAKQVASEFIEGRTNDRIGLVVFSAESFTQCPLTTDYDVLRNLLSEVRNGMIEDGTAIGLALANAVNRLKDSEAKSKVVILLTDGVNNRGEIDPITAAKIASTYRTRVYTVGVGAQGQAPYPVQTPFGIRKQLVPVEIDEKTLTEVAAITGGTYYRATDNRKLKAIYQEIDALERTRIEVTAYKRTTDLFFPWLFAGLLAFVSEVALSSSYLRKNP